MMSEHVQSHFDRLAQALERGDCAAFAGVLRVPTIVQVGTARLYCPSTEAMTGYMRQYRENLLVQGYARTVVRVVAESPTLDGGRRVLVHWKHLNRHGGLIREIFASYLLIPTPEGGWQQTDVEFVDDLPPRLAAGLPLDTTHANA